LTSIAYFGGSFDPIHHAHLRLALEVKHACNFDQLFLVPAHKPPHKQALGASAGQRLAMLKLALAACPELAIDDRELHRDGPSYTVDTLAQLRREQGPQTSISWVIGGDSLASLHHWHRWRGLLELGHLVVMQRPGSDNDNSLHPDVRAAVAQCRGEVSDIRARPAGTIVLLELSQLAISATKIRSDLGAGRSAQFLLPDSVLAYIRSHDLYQQCD
jgi:nicotinate-nucleotide adenylyltransferase